MMRFTWMTCLTIIALELLGTSGRPAAAEEPAKTGDAPSEPAANARSPEQAVELALDFMVQDAVKWRENRVCATCHHGTFTVWTLNEAKLQGYRVNAEALAEATKWTKDLFVPRFSKPRDSRPGWNLVSTPAIYLGLMSYTLPVLSRDEINRVAIHLAAHQEEDGVWLMPPPANGAPPIWESPETVALLALLAWEPFVSPDPKVTAAAQASREKALAWLNANKSSETVQALAFRLLLNVRMGKPAEQLAAEIDRLLKKQNSDGGWSQVADAPSDAYATGQTLWVLSFAGLKADRPEIARAVAFLVSSQREDGSWAMTSRNHPGVVTTRNPIRNPIPITYFGSAWATLGLLRFVPAPADPSVRQKAAIDYVRLFGGKYEVDETSVDKPVVRVQIHYLMDDMGLEEMMEKLKGLPKLATLTLKSPKITDAGLARFKSLPQLRSLTLEDAAITDAGVPELKELKYLEVLNLKGTKVTDAGVKDLQQALPKLKVER